MSDETTAPQPESRTAEAGRHKRTVLRGSVVLVVAVAVVWLIAQFRPEEDKYQIWFDIPIYVDRHASDVDGKDLAKIGEVDGAELPKGRWAEPPFLHGGRLDELPFFYGFYAVNGSEPRICLSIRFKAIASASEFAALQQRLQRISGKVQKVGELIPGQGVLRAELIVDGVLKGP